MLSNVAIPVQKFNSGNTTASESIPWLIERSEATFLPIILPVSADPHTKGCLRHRHGHAADENYSEGFRNRGSIIGLCVLEWVAISANDMDNHHRDSNVDHWSSVDHLNPLTIGHLSTTGHPLTIGHLSALQIIVSFHRVFQRYTFNPLSSR